MPRKTEGKENGGDYRRDRGGYEGERRLEIMGVKNGGDWEGWRERKDYHSAVAGG